MREIGGYIELEKSRNNLYYEDAVALNCGRNCLEYVIRVKNIKKIKLPYYLCSTVRDKCDELGVEINYYHINDKFIPILDSILEDEWVYVVNYYGLLHKDDILDINTKCSHRLIVDNSQAFFKKPLNDIITLYTCRKFFGVPDGAYLYIDKLLEEDLPVDISYNRMNFLLGRFELGAEKFYSEYVNNNEFFSNEPLKKMSKLTENLLRVVDYDFVKKARTKNFQKLNENLAGINELQLENIEGAFAYPLLISNGIEVKSKLIKKKIYIPTLWNDGLEKLNENDLETYYINNILPIPCDQRYDEKDMEYIIKSIYKLLGG